MPLHEITVVRKIDAGHRVVGHQGKCRYLHGHTYTFEVTLASNQLTSTGFVVDFGDIKVVIDRWDHRLILWKDDPTLFGPPEIDLGVVRVPFNPTAENMAQYLADEFILFAHVLSATVSVSETESTTAIADAYRA